MTLVVWPGSEADTILRRCLHGFDAGVVRLLSVSGGHMLPLTFKIEFK